MLIVRGRPTSVSVVCGTVRQVMNSCSSSCCLLLLFIILYIFTSSHYFTNSFDFTSTFFFILFSFIESRGSGEV